MSLVFFFQAEDGIRDWSVTGVQTCALPIFAPVVITDLPQPAVFVARPIELVNEPEPLKSPIIKLALKVSRFFAQRVRLVADDSEPAVSSDVNGSVTHGDVPHIIAGEPVLCA